MSAPRIHISFHLILMLIISLVISACDNSDPVSTQSSTPHKRNHRVEVNPAYYKDLAQTIESTGVVTAQQHIKIHSQSEGRILSLPYHPGDSVTAGELLVQIDNRLIRAELKKARAETRQSNYQLGQVQKLIKQQLVAKERLIETETKLEIAQAEQTLLEIQLGNSRITAPFDGVITERLLEPGDIVKQHQHILSLINPNSLYIKTQISDQFVHTLKPGDSVRVWIDTLDDQAHLATIRRIHPTIHPQTLKNTLELQLDSLNIALRTGQLCRIEFNINPHQRLLIPVSALRNDAQGSFVFALNQQQKVQRISVKTGLFFGDNIEIQEGLKQGTMVVTRGFLGLSHGMEVTVRTTHSTDQSL